MSLGALADVGAAPLPGSIYAERSRRSAARMDRRLDTAERMRRIIMLVADDACTTSARLKGPSRVAALVFPRHVAMYLCRKLTGASYPEIGRALGGRNHATVISAVRAIECARSDSASVRATVDSLCTKLRVIDP